MAGRTPTARYRGIFYNWGTKKATQAAGQARMQIYKDGLQIMSFDDDGKDTSGDSNGPQTKMNQTATTTGDVTGMNVSPRIASGYNGASITALKLEPYLKGTNSMSGDYRALEIGMDDTGTNTVTGDAVAIRVFSQMRVNPTADFAVMEVEPQGDIGVWNYLAKLPDDSAMAWSAWSTSIGTGAGAIRVKVGSAVRFISLFTRVPID